MPTLGSVAGMGVAGLRAHQVLPGACCRIDVAQRQSIFNEWQGCTCID